jgi:hypothetical protein
LHARSPRGHHSVTDTLNALKARIAQLEAELASSEQHSAGHRVDFERERDRADRVIIGLVAELEALRRLLEAKEADRPVTSRTWREMNWRERWRWLRTTG